MKHDLTISSLRFVIGMLVMFWMGFLYGAWNMLNAGLIVSSVWLIFLISEGAGSL